MTARTSPRRRLGASATSLALVLGLLLVSAPAGAADPATDPSTGTTGPVADESAVNEPAADEPAADESSANGPDATAAAEEALAEVQQIIGAEPAGAAEAEPGSGGPVTEDLSLALRDLALQLPALDRGDRRTARRLLARPTSYFQGDAIAYQPDAELSSECGPRVCVHWVEGTRDTPPASDLDDDGVLDQVQRTLATAEDVWDRTVAMGFRAPLRDGVDVADPDRGGRFDIYLADLGGLRTKGVYGYCAFEPKRGYRHAGASYCVIDNDFARRQYFDADPALSLQETVAHEFFHAVQFAYDGTDDLWFMESSAAWIEDELFDDANGNRFFLRDSQLALPGRPLDDPRARYGGWVFLRWLSEKFGPAIVLESWRQADSVDGPDRWGVRAIDAALRKRGTTLARQLPAYATALRFAETSFEEGRERGWASARPDGTVLLGRRSPNRTVRGIVVRQLASAAVEVPTRRSTRRMSRLVVEVDTPARSRGVKVSLVQVRRDGRRVTRTVATDRTGAGRAQVGFARPAVKKVLVVLTGTSTRMACWRGSSLSCEGLRRDDRLPVDVRVSGR